MTAHFHLNTSTIMAENYKRRTNMSYSATKNFERLQQYIGDETANFMYALYRVAGSKSTNQYPAGVYLKHAEVLDDAKVAAARNRPLNSPSIRRAHDMLDRILVIFDEVKSEEAAHASE